jgi:hypothetical protein
MHRPLLIRINRRGLTRGLRPLNYLDPVRGRVTITSGMRPINLNGKQEGSRGDNNH